MNHPCSRTSASLSLPIAAVDASRRYSERSLRPLQHVQPADGRAAWAAGGGAGAAGASTGVGDGDLVRGGARLHARLGRGEEPLLLVGVEDHGAAEVRHVAAGQIGAFELGLAHPVEEDLVLADEDGVPVAQRPFRDLLAVHEGPVGALEILDDELRTLARDADVARRYRRVVDHDRVVRQATDGHRGRVRHSRLLQHSTLEQKHQLGHVVRQFLLSAKSASVPKPCNRP